jgi:hypothetical protein
MYFPAYEVITGPHASYFEADLRSVSPVGVAHVMRLFGKHLLRTNVDSGEGAQADQSVPAKPALDDEAELRAGHAVVCDEEAIDGG